MVYQVLLTNPNTIHKNLKLNLVANWAIEWGSIYCIDLYMAGIVLRWVEFDVLNNMVFIMYLLIVTVSLLLIHC